MRHARFALAAALAAGLAALGPATPADAGQLTVGAGSTLDLGSASLALGCADLDVSGTFAAGSVGFTGARDIAINPSGSLNGNSALLSLSGDWDNAGSFSAGTSTVQMVDGCALFGGVVSGNSTFKNFSIHSTTAKQVRFTAGSTQSVTGLLALIGASGNRLKIRSTVNGVVAFFISTGIFSINFVDVDDNNAQPGNDLLVSSNSLKGPNTPGWLQNVAAPTLAPLGITLLALLLLATGRHWLQRSTRAEPRP